jgi:hypothetical protein
MDAGLIVVFLIGSMAIGACCYLLGFEHGYRRGVQWAQWRIRQRFYFEEKS